MALPARRNPIDAIVAFFSAEAGFRRARARHAIRIYEGATGGRRSTSWKALHTGANAELQYAIRPLRDRSRDLSRNTPFAARALDILGAHVVGNGIIPVSNTGSDKIDKKVTAVWNEWVDQCDVTGQLNFYAMQVLALRSMVESGEIVCRFIDQKMSDDAAVPMQLQLLEADYIDQWRDGFYGQDADETKGVDGFQRSRLGVGLGKYDKKLGLWLWPYHPGEFTTVVMQPGTSEFVPMTNLLHMFKVLRPGQCRGMPWFAPVLTQARDLSDFVDAANVKARVEACFAAFITNDDTSTAAGLLDINNTGVDPTNDQALPNAGLTSLEPGMLKELRAGQDIKFAQPTSNSQVEPMLLYNLQAIAAGIGLTYDQMTGDLRQANYSSLRAGKLDFWRLVGQLQNLTVIPQFCQPTWNRVMNRAVLAGRLPKPAKGLKGYPCNWIVPAKEMIDPKKDFDATKNMVRAGGMTPQAFIASFGGDPRTTIEDFKRFFDEAHKKEVTLDIDVSRVDQHGRQPSKPAAGEQDPASVDPTDLDDGGDDAAANAGDDDE